MRKIYLRIVLLIVLLCSGLNAEHTFAQSASFTATADTVCQGSCITFTNTSTGAIDSIRWFVNGVTISNPDSNVTTACFSMAGNDTVMLFVFDSGRIDTATLIVHVNPVPSPIIGANVFCNNFPIFYTTLTDTTLGGVWRSSDTSIELVDSNGIVTNGIVGFVPYDSTAILYVLPSGCFASMVVYDLTCEGIPTVAANDETITIHPNPATTSLTISSPEKITTIAITNLLGQVVYTHEYSATQVEVNVAGFPTGVYFVKINGTDSGTAQVRKFIKQ